MKTRSSCFMAVGVVVLLLLAFCLIQASAAASSGLPESTIVGGAITVDTTWTLAGSPYIVQDQNVTVNDSVMLTIEPGVTVQLNAGKSLMVHGMLLAGGTPTLPITFTRTAGSTQPWGHVQIGGGSVVTDSDASGLSYVTIEGGGSGTQMLYIYDSAPTLDHLTLRNSGHKGVYVGNGATVSPVSWDGGTVDGNTDEGVYVATGRVALSNLTIAGNGADGVELHLADDSQLLNSTVQGNGGEGVHTLSSDRVLLEGLTIAGNAGYGIYVQADGAAGGVGTIVRDTTVQGNGVAARLHPDTVLDNVTWTGNTRSEIEWITGRMNSSRTWARLPEMSTYVVLGSVTAPDNTTLSVEPGVTVQLQPGVSLYANGGLQAVGTPTQPITFTRATGATQPWGMIEIGSGNVDDDADDSRVSYATIEGGGSVGKLVHLYCTSAHLDHVTVRDGSSVGIQVYPLAGKQITLDTVAVTDNAGVAIYHVLPDLSLTYRGLTLQGNGTDAVSIDSGSIATPVEWDIADAGVPVRTGSLTVHAGGLLALTPGSELEFTAAARLDVYYGSGVYALGNPRAPITLTGTIEQPGAWKGVWLMHGSHAILRNCNIEYGGAGGEPGLKLQSPNVILINSHVRHAAGDGVVFDTATPPVIGDDDISENAFGVRNNRTDVTVDARRVWWGDPSGPYHATLNPDGLGNAVSDRVLFQPWLTSVPSGTLPLNGLLVRVTGPRFSSLGKDAFYAATYLNETGQEITDAVLTLVLPETAAFVEANGEVPAIYWPERHQVFFRLGTVPAGEGGYVVVHIYYYCCIPGHTATIMALMAGSNQGETTFDLASYLAYDPVRLLSSVALTPAEVAAERQAYPILDGFFTQGEAEGFGYASAERIALSPARSLVDITLNRLEPEATMHILREGQVVQAYVVDNSTFTLHSVLGDLVYDRVTDSTTFTGARAGGVAALAAGFERYPSTADCYENCLEEEAKVFIIKALLRAMLGLPPVTNRDIGAFLKCEAECLDDPTSHYCIEDKFSCESSNPIFPNTAQRVMKRKCDPETGELGPAEFMYQCSFAFPVEKCVIGPGGMPRCVECPAAPPPPIEPEPEAKAALTCPDLDEAGGGCSTCTTGVGTPKDPNAKYGPLGDLLPGDLVSYTVTYENVGDGEALGVYVEDRLTEHLDENTLKIGGGGLYLPASRTIVWEIGELGPHGSPTAGGSVTVTARLRDGLPGGTPIINQAVVYFPTVPEETPTNPVVNVIWPVVGVPMSVTVQAGQSVPITLAGRDTGPGPLTFQVVDSPGHGTLAGSPPTLTYTPFAGFSGLDLFTFKVSNAITDSRPAEAKVLVVPDPDDTTPPIVSWTAPADNAVVGPISTGPILTDTFGPIYTPYVFAGFSEAIDASTVTTSTLVLTAPDGTEIMTTVSYNGANAEAVVLPRRPLEPLTWYSVRATTGITDLAGNPLAAEYSWTFRTAGTMRVFLPLVLRRY